MTRPKFTHPDSKTSKAHRTGAKAIPTDAVAPCTTWPQHEDDEGTDWLDPVTIGSTRDPEVREHLARRLSFCYRCPLNIRTVCRDHRLGIPDEHGPKGGILVTGAELYNLPEDHHSRNIITRRAAHLAAQHNGKEPTE